MKDLKLHWGFTLCALILGAVISYFIFRCDPRTDEGDFVDGVKDDLIEEVQDTIEKDSIDDVQYDSIDKKEDKIIKSNNDKTKKIISNGIDPIVYDSLVRSNRARGVKRITD